MENIKSKTNCSIVIPVYRGEKTLTLLIERLHNTLPNIASRFEVICVDDGSPDGSWDVISSLSKKYTWIRGIKLMRNYGQHNATLCGVRVAQFPITVTMDDDLQHPPDEIHKLIEAINSGFDVVYGAPIKLPQGLFRNIATKLTKHVLAFVMRVPSVKYISAFRAFRTHLRNASTNFQCPNVTLDVLLSWGTTRFTSIPVNIAEPHEDRTNYSFTKLIAQALLVLTGYSTAPLRLASIMGFVMTFMGLLILIYVLYVYFFEGSIPGFSFITSMIALFSGTQLFTLGIVGEYLARIFNRSMDRPTYVIEEITSQDNMTL